MKMVIDFTEKKIELEGEWTFTDLQKVVEHNNLQDFTITAKKTSIVDTLRSSSMFDMSKIANPVAIPSPSRGWYGSSSEPSMMSKADFDRVEAQLKAYQTQKFTTDEEDTLEE